MKKIRNLLPQIILVFSLQAICGTPEIKTNYYIANGGESLRELLVNQAQLDPGILDDLGYYQKISSWNPHIKNKNVLQKGQEVYVEIPYDYFIKPKKIIASFPKPKPKPDACRVPSSLQNLSDDEIAILTELKEKTIKEKLSDKAVGFANFLRTWKTASYYTISRSIFEESVINSTTRTQISQDSPFTLASSIDKAMDENFSLAGELYISLNDEAITETNQPMKLPLYYGGNLKLGFKRVFWPFTMHGGFELDSFSSFNTDEVVLGAKLELRDHRLLNMGVGAKKEMTLFGKEFLFQGFYSQTISSYQSRASTVNSSPFKGSKFSAEGRMMYGGDWFYHAFYKQLDLKGATVLHVAKFGLGFGLYF